MPQPSLDLRPAQVKAGAMLDEQSRRERYRPLDCRDLVAGGVVHRVISAASVGQAACLFARRFSRLEVLGGDTTENAQFVEQLQIQDLQTLFLLRFSPCPFSLAPFFGKG